MKQLIVALLFAVFCGGAIAQHQAGGYSVASRQQILVNRAEMTRRALAPVWNMKTRTWEKREWRSVTGKNGVKVRFQKLGYAGFVHLAETGYVPIGANYPVIHRMLTSGHVDDAVNLIRGSAMMEGLIPFEEPSEGEDRP